MTGSAILHRPHAKRVISALSLAALIRLVSEIDDNGPISRSRGSLQGAFGDLTRHQLRHAIDVARTLGLVPFADHAPDRYRLTEAGEDLAAVYDAVARWARTHQLPGPFSDFVTRVQHTLALLEDGDVAPSAKAASEVLQLRGVLAEWLQAHPHILRAVASSLSQTEDETEQAA